MTRPEVVESQWCGAPRYGCSLCAFDTLDKVRADEHIAHGHTIPRPKVVTDPVIESVPNGLAPSAPATKGSN